MIDESLLPTERDLEFYRENGYWISPRIFSDEEIARFNTAIDRIHDCDYETGHEPWSRSWNPGDSLTALRKTDNAHWSNFAVRDLVLSETIGAMAARLMETPEVRLWHDQMLFKPGQGPQATDTGNVGWHQDHNYWRCTCPDLVTAWAALCDVDLGNGCMHFVPGSHRWGNLEGDFFNQDLESTKRHLEQQTGEEFRSVPIILEAGQVSFHHCLTIHGSGPNRTQEPRRSFAIHLQPEHAAYRSGTDCDGHQCCVLLRHHGGGEGDRFRGPTWPTLFPARSEVREGPSHRQIISLVD